MPREDVPYPGRDNCSIRCKLKEIWDALQGKLHSVNGLTGNGSENVNIVSTTPQTLSVNNNPSLQQVELAVDLQSPTIAGDLTVDGDLIANGDIIQNGAAYETHAQKVLTVDDYIVTRDGAVGPLAAGDYSGFEITKYDGTNNGRLVVDREGTARVGDVGDEQALATRDESSDLTDGDLVKWDATNLKLIDAGVKPEDLGLELYDENSYAPGTVTPFNQYSVALPLNTGKEFETGYDYTIIITSSDDYAMNIKTTRTTETPGNTTFSIQIQAGEVATPTIVYAVYRLANGGNAPTVNVIGSCSVKQQTKLVSGTNIKTINNQSILGAGDIAIAAGGLNWTQRTGTNDWSDMFEYQSAPNTMIAKKHIMIFNNGRLLAYIPKGLQNLTGFNIPVSPNMAVSGSAITVQRHLVLDSTALLPGSSSITVAGYKFEFTTDGSTISIARSNQNATMTKSSTIVYVSD